MHFIILTSTFPLSLYILSLYSFTKFNSIYRPIIFTFVLIIHYHVSKHTNIKNYNMGAGKVLIVSGPGFLSQRLPVGSSPCVIIIRGSSALYWPFGEPNLHIGHTYT